MLHLSKDVSIRYKYGFRADIARTNDMYHAVPGA